MKLLVLGAGGLLGSAFMRWAPGLGHEVVGTVRPGAGAPTPVPSSAAPGPRAHPTATPADTLVPLDVTDHERVREVVYAVRPDAVLFCAGLTRVDEAELRPHEAFAVNADAARCTAEAAASIGARCVYFSTDYVFDGARRTPYPPDHPTAPLTAYGRSKAAGEEAVLEASPDALVARVSWLFGPGRPCFVTAMLERARAGGALRVVADQRTRPTYTRNAVEVTLDLLAAEARGIVHVADGGPVPSRLEIVQHALAVAGIDAEVAPLTAAQLWPDVPRPAYTALDLAATETLLGRAMEDWRTSLRRFVRAWAAGEGPDTP